MDIKHLLGHPCDPYSSFLLKKSSRTTTEFDNLIHIVAEPQQQYQRDQHGDDSLFFGEQVEFLSHSRSNSTQSVSSCSSSGQSSITGNVNQQSPSSIMSSPCTSPILKSRNQHYYQRQRVNSETCRRSVSAISSGGISASSSQQHHHYHQATTRRSSASYIQTRTPWTPEEDDLLQKGYEQGLSWAMISCTYLPHRSRGCCWGRFKTLQSKNVIEVYQQRICQRPWKITGNSKGGDRKKILHA
jgi:hypothetical protein